MADRWLGLCRDEVQEDLRRALMTISRDAGISFASSAQDLRAKVSEATQPVGAMVGPLEGGVSSVNLAAALVADGMASEVVLVAPGVSSSLRRRAEAAGITRLIDLSALVLAAIDDLDEPYDDIGDLPTMVIDASGAFLSPRASAVPAPVRGAGSKAPRLRSLPRVEDSAEMDAAKAQPKDDAREGSSAPAVVAERAMATPAQGPRPPAARHEPKQEVAPDGGQSAHVAPVIVLVSGRGGVGKTSVAATMALAASSWGMRVAALDLDLACGNLYSCFGMGEVADLAGLAQVPDGQTEHLVGLGREAAEGLTLWGPCELPEMSETVGPHVGSLLRCLRERHNLVLVDTSATFTDAVAQAAQACDRLVIVVDNRPGTTVAQARLAALAVRLGVARTRIVRLANRCGPHGRGEPIINRAEVGLETARTLRVADGGAEVADCLGEGRIGDLRDLGSRFYASAGSALATMLSELGCLPQTAEARRALEGGVERPRWGFGHKREAR